MTAILYNADLPLAELRPYPGNARRGDIDGIRKSLRANRQYKSLTVRKHGDRADGSHTLTILAGNNTRLAMLAEGWTTARCEVIKCSNAEARRINAADNALNDHATYDGELHREQLAALQGDYEGSGYTAEQAARILAVDLPSAGDPAAGNGAAGHASWGVVITCDDETEQAALLDRFTAEGLTVRALTGGA